MLACVVEQVTDHFADEIVDLGTRSYLRIRKRSVGGYMERTYRLEHAHPTNEDDETLVIRTRYKSHWSEWTRFEPADVDLLEQAR